MAKTIKISALIDLANTFMRDSPDDARMDRLHVQDFMQLVLTATDNPTGFDFVTDLFSAGNDSSRVIFRGGSTRDV